MKQRARDAIRKFVEKNIPEIKKPSTQLGSGEGSLLSADEPVTAKPDVLSTHMFPSLLESLGRGLEEVQNAMNSEDISDQYVNLKNNHDITGNVVDIKGNQNKLDIFLNMNELINNLDKSGINLKQDEYGINLIEEVVDELNAVRETTRIKVAADSGSCRNVIHPKCLPSGIKIVPPTTQANFSGAGGESIKRHGTCETLLTQKDGTQVGCGWDAAEVTRPLHSISQICGPEDDPIGKQDVLFNNRFGVVVPPGIVDHIMKYVQAAARYDREGNLYLAEMTVSDFIRPGQSS